MDTDRERTQDIAEGLESSAPVTGGCFFGDAGLARKMHLLSKTRGLAPPMRGHAMLEEMGAATGIARQIQEDHCAHL